MRLAAVCVLAGAIVLAALLVSMGTNDGCLPWQTPNETRRGATVCE